MQKLLMIIGIIVFLIGLFWPWIVRIGFGHLPGDIILKKENVTFYFPIVTCLILSLLLSILFWFLHK